MIRICNVYFINTYLVKKVLKYLFLFFIAKRDEGRSAKILFAIVIFFVICNVPRAMLDLEEFAVIAPSYWAKYKPVFNRQLKDDAPILPLCYSPPFWAHILQSVSKFLLTLNASAGCFIYCVLCKGFRKELSHTCQYFISVIMKLFRTS